MIVSGFPILNNYQTSQYNRTPFCASKKADNVVFIHKSSKFKMRLYSPFSETYCESPVKIHFEKPQTIELSNTDKREDNIIVQYDPSKVGTLYDKETKEPIQVAILKSQQKHYDGFCAYHFMSKDLQHEYGYVEIYKPCMREENFNELKRDYPEYGLVGKRIEVLYLKNYDDKKIGGVGKLADKVCVDYCLEHGMKPNIVSYAEVNSHVAHFKRGKRFIPPETGTEDATFLQNKYGKTDPNGILAELIKNSEQTHKKVDLTGWGYLMMYLPREVAEKYTDL